MLKNIFVIKFIIVLIICSTKYIRIGNITKIALLGFSEVYSKNNREEQIEKNRTKYF